jgi:hypothetical protein
MHWLAWDKVARPKSFGGVGFRDLRVFNQALLARQAWRLLQFPNTLCARVLRAKYFPAGNLLDTAFIQNSSPSWQGVMHGLELLKEGAIWRIGNGSEVKIWRDNWLPRQGQLKPSGRRNNAREKWVSELIDPMTRQWDVAKVRRIFHPQDAEVVLNIKIPARPVSDMVAWHPEKHGLFTVRSAYRLGMRATWMNSTSGQSSTSPEGERSIWNIIWKCPIPQKIRVFAWRLATDSLAVMAKLHRRIPKTDPTCSICGTEQEDAHHAVVRCTMARALRDGLRSVWSIPPEHVFQLTGVDWFLQLLSTLTEELRVKVLFMFWRAWHHRNNIVHGDGKASVSASVPYLQNYVETLRILPSFTNDVKGKAPLCSPSQCRAS